MRLPRHIDCTTVAHRVIAYLGQSRILAENWGVGEDLRSADAGDAVAEDEVFDGVDWNVERLRLTAASQAFVNSS